MTRRALHHVRWHSIARCVATILCLSGCATGRPPAQITGTAGSSANDPALFGAVVRVIADSTRMPLRVDPRPLKADPMITDADPSAYADVPPSIVQARTMALKQLHISQTADATRGRCLGTSIPPLPGARVDEKALYCPAQNVAVAAIGLARPGGAYYTYGVDQRAEGLKQGDWVVRVVLTTLTPYGSNENSYDYVMHRDHGLWHFVKLVGVMFE